MIGQITKTLPKIAWEDAVIEENNEPLEEISESERVKLASQDKNPILVRKTIADKIIRLSRLLPSGVNFMIIEGYRTMEVQTKLWNDEFNKIKRQNIDWTDEQVIQKLKLFIAQPNPLANHHCGGAIDLTLVRDDGTELDMGTPYIKSSYKDFYQKFPMLSEQITDKQKENRKILRDLMDKEDFVWYPGEWWHYCWGDRMWAVYSNQNRCFYGPIEV